MQGVNSYKERNADVQLYTYIIESQGYYKIGKSIDMEQRLGDYNTHNPVYKLICVIKGDYEDELHEKYDNKRFKLEWFSLTEDEVNQILNTDIYIFEDLEKAKSTKRLARKEHLSRLKEEKRIKEWQTLTNEQRQTLENKLVNEKEKIERQKILKEIREADDRVRQEKLLKKEETKKIMKSGGVVVSDQVVPGKLRFNLINYSTQQIIKTYNSLLEAEQDTNIDSRKIAENLLGIKQFSISKKIACIQVTFRKI